MSWRAWRSGKLVKSLTSAPSMLKTLNFECSRVTNISVLSSMPLLEKVSLYNNGLGIKDLSPLAECKRLHILNIVGNQDIEDISPLAQCTQLERLYMWGLTKISDLKPLSSLTKLKDLNISCVPVQDLTPLSVLQDLEELHCYFIPPTTSLLPLARCIKLKSLYCDNHAKDLDLLRERRPDIKCVGDNDGHEEEGEEDEDDEDDEGEDV